MNLTSVLASGLVSEIECDISMNKRIRTLIPIKQAWEGTLENYSYNKITLRLEFANPMPQPNIRYVTPCWFFVSVFLPDYYFLEFIATGVITKKHKNKKIMNRHDDQTRDYKEGRQYKTRAVGQLYMGPIQAVGYDNKVLQTTVVEMEFADSKSAERYMDATRLKMTDKTGLIKQNRMRFRSLSSD